MEHNHKTGVVIDRSAALCSKTAYCIRTATGGREKVGEAERLEDILIRTEMSEGCSWHKCTIQLANAVSGFIRNFTSVFTRISLIRCVDDFCHGIDMCIYLKLSVHKGRKNLGSEMVLIMRVRINSNLIQRLNYRCFGLIGDRLCTTVQTFRISDIK